MDPTQLAQLVSNVGFPIVVAGYLLLRLDKQLQSLIALQQQTLDAVERQAQVSPKP